MPDHAAPWTYAPGGVEPAEPQPAWGNETGTAGVKPRFVEFFGLPCTGKTTIANQCIANVRSSGAAVYSSADVKRMFRSTNMTRKVGRIAAAGPLAWWPMYLALQAPPFMRIPFEGELHYRMRAALNAPLYFLPLRKMECDAHDVAVLCDEWLAQQMWGACLFNECKLSAAAKFIRHFTTRFDVLYVILDLDPAAAAERAYERAMRRRQGLDRNFHRILDHLERGELIKIYLRGHEMFLRISELIEGYATRCIRIDANRTVEENSRFIINSVRSTKGHPEPTIDSAVRTTQIRDQMIATGGFGWHARGTLSEPKTVRGGDN